MHNTLSWLPIEAKFYYNLLLFMKKAMLLGTPHFFSAQMQYPNHIHNYASLLTQ